MVKKTESKTEAKTLNQEHSKPDPSNLAPGVDGSLLSNETTGQKRVRKPVKSANINSPVIDKHTNDPVVSIPPIEQPLVADPVSGVPKIRSVWPLITGVAISGLVIGFLVSYIGWVIPLRNDLSVLHALSADSDTSTNQIISDLSETRLKQEEMEVRYQAVSEQLENANRYIFLLRMKEQISIARLMVETKEGFLARQSLAEIQNRFEQLQPFIDEKNSTEAKEMEDLIKVSIQHLSSDPESVKDDLSLISKKLDFLETMLFHPEQ
jgi:hypothetical protein